MQPHAVVVDTTKETVSSWWHWGVAIVISLLALGSALASAVTIIFWENRDFILDDWDVEHPGDYPENGSAEDQREWNRTMEDFETKELVENVSKDIDESGVIEFVAVTQALVFLTAIPVVVMLFSKDENAFKYTGYWLGGCFVLTIASQIYFHSLTVDIFDRIPELGSNFAIYNTIGGIVEAITCYMCLFGVLIVCSAQVAKGKLIPESGFHRNNVEMVVVSNDIEPTGQIVMNSPSTKQTEFVKQVPAGLNADIIVGHVGETRISTQNVTEEE